MYRSYYYFRQWLDFLVFHKKKYNTEVDSNLINNMQESLDFYMKLSDDNKERLEEVLKRNEQLESELDALKKQN